MTLNNKICLLTGAGSGIGRALAHELSTQGVKLILCDMHLSSLHETIAIHAIENHVLGCIEVNLLDHDAVEQTLAQAFAISTHIDILYNNAGMMAMGQANNMPWSDFQRMQTVNQNVPIELAHRLLPNMIAQGGGFIAFTASASALNSPPGAAFYGMTKAAVCAFAEALRAEVAHKNIIVTAICPGFVHTPLVKNIAYRDEKSKQQTTSVPSFMGSSPEKIARLSVSAMKKNKGTVLIGGDEKFKRWIKFLSPWLYSKLNLLMAKLLLDD